MGWITDMGQQAAQGIVGAGLGMTLGRINDKYQDKRQLSQQGKLQAMQEAGEIRVGKAMGDYNIKNAKDMWEYTGYGGQMRQIKEAGLNPALLYGMKGGGGITTGPAASAGNVGTDTTHRTSSDPTASMGMAMQIGLMRAQKENIEADTANKQADTANKPLTGQNIEANTGLTKINTAMQQVALEVANATKEEAIQRITAEAGIAQEQNVQSGVGTQIARGTQEATIQRINTMAMQAILQNKEIQSEIRRNDSQVQLNSASINKMAEDIAQGWQKLSIDARNAGSNERNAATSAARQEWDKYINNVRASTKLTVETAEGLIQSILRRSPGKSGSKTYREGEKDGKPYSEYSETTPIK